MTRQSIIKGLGYALCALCALICVHYAYDAVVTGMRQYDFQYNPVRILLNGENPYLYSLNHIKFEGWQIDANQVPSCLALLIPFAFLPRALANNVWAFCNIGFTLMFLYYVYQIWFKNGKAPKAIFVLLSFLLISGQPWRVLVGNGQHLLFSLAFFMAAYYYADKDRPYLAGVMLALSAFKYTTIAPMGFIFLYRKCWKSIGVAAAIHILLTLAVSVWLKESPLTLIEQSLTVSGALAGQGSADIVSVLVKHGVNVSPLVMNLTYLFYALVCACALFGTKDEMLKLAIFAVVSNVMFYHRVYDFVVLIVPTLCLLHIALKRKTSLYWALLGLAFVVMMFGFNAAKTFQLLVRIDPPDIVWTASQHFLLVSLLVVNFVKINYHGACNLNAHR